MRGLTVTLSERRADEPIAIVGMSGRFPGAPDVEALWEVLLDGRDTVTEAPSDRPWMRELHDPQPGTPGKVPTTRGGFLPGLDLFDAAFFDMSAREARRADPQLRLLLEVAYEAAQDAGIPMRRMAGTRTGVFVGNVAGDYWLRQVADLEGLDFYAEMGASWRGALSGRMAYAFDLQGPAVSMDTACSSSMTAIHLACQSIRAGECEAAIAGGANLILAPYSTVTLGSAGALSPDGRSKFADASANGYARSEAVGLVLLKPLDRALADGDRVRAVVLGSAANNDGFTGSGMVAPRPQGQAAMLRAAYANAGVDPRDVAFVEAHGTGTPLGDQVELTALSDVLGPRGAGRERLLVNSAKVCVGHTEAAAGVVGLIKAVLCLEHRTAPGNPLLVEPNPAIDWEAAPLRVPATSVDLTGSGEPLLAGVSGFGATGTNVHVVLRSAPTPSVERSAEQDSGRPGLLAISARSPEALRELAGQYTELLDPAAGSPPPLRQVCAAAATRRDHWEHRLAVTADSAAAMTDGLRAFLDEREHSGLVSSPRAGARKPRIVFVFPGQGSQWLGMGRELLAANRPFRDAIDECDVVIRKYGGWSLIDALCGDDDGWLQRTERVQPALWAMSVALDRLWRSWGIEPDAVLGQSQGEIAAAHCAGALTLEEAGRLSCLRAELIDHLAPEGAVCWVERPHTDILALLADLGVEASVAVAEGPASTVLSGTVEAIERIIRGCERRGVSCQRVHVGYAAHSPQMDPLRELLLEGLADLEPSATSVPFLSTVTGGELPGTALDRDYWWRNLRETVQLDHVVRSVLAGPQPVVFLQMSPHPVLTTALRDNAGADTVVLESLRRGQPELSCLYRTLSVLYAARCDPDWEQVHGAPGPFLDLPRYPWQRTRHWYQAAGFPWPEIGSTSRPPVPATNLPKVSAAAPTPAHPWLAATDTGAPGSRGWKVDLGHDEFLLDHAVAGQPVMPGAGFLELALAASQRLLDGRSAELREIEFRQLLPLDAQAAESPELRVTGEPDGEGWRVRIAGRTGATTGWSDHARARVVPVELGDTPQPTTASSDIRNRCSDWQPGELFYRDHRDSGNTWQGAFRGIAELWRGDSEALARLRPVDGSGFRFHPAMLDACLQVAVPMLSGPAQAGSRGFVLLGMDRVRLLRPYAGGPLWSHALLGRTTQGEPSVDVTVLDDSDAVIMRISGIRGKRVPASHAGHATRSDTLAQGRHSVVWRETAGRPAPAEAGHWLIVGDDTDLDRRLAEQLAAAGGVVSTVRPGNGFMVEGPGRFRAAPGSQDDVARVLAEATLHAPLRGVVSTQALSAGSDDAASPRLVQWTATELCATVVRLARSVRSLAQPTPPRIFLLTRGAQATVPQDTCPAPWQAVLWSLGPILRKERPDCPTVLVDLDEQGTGGASEAADLTALLLAPGAENKLALRRGQRLAPRLRAADPDARTPVQQARIRPDTTYLVTGGASGIGALVAQWLVGQGARHLLLTGRSHVDPNGSDPRATLLKRLRSDGAEVSYAPVDVDDPQTMAQLLHRREQQGLPPVGGVVHSAGVLDPAPTIDLSEDDLRAALRAKVAGGWTLHQLFADQSLDFFVVFSSIMSVLGGLSLSVQLGAYAAGNAFLEALTTHRRAAGLPSTVVNWGYWVDTGLAQRLGESSGHDVRPAGMLPIHSVDGPELFTAMLGADGQMIHLPVDWPTYLAAYPQDADNPLLSEIADRDPDEAADTPPAVPVLATQVAGPVVAPVRQDLPGPSSPSAPGVEGMVEHLAKHLGAVLGVDPERVDRFRPLKESGMDSLMAAELRNLLRRELGQDVPISRLLGGAGVHDLATELATTSAPQEASATRVASARPIQVPQQNQVGDSRAQVTIQRDEAASLATRFQAVWQEGSHQEAIDLLEKHSRLRPTFTTPAGPPEVGRPEILARGDGARPRLICLSSFQATAGPHEYAHLATQLGREHTVWALPNPGYAPGETLPDSRAALVAAQARAALRCADDAPFVLVGHSSAGWVAHAVADQLSSSGAALLGLVLLDTATPDDAWSGLRTRAAQSLIDPRKPLADSALTAMGHYLRLFAGWTPTPVSVPVLRVRATDAPEPAGTGHDRAWQRFPCDLTQVPGDHFSIVREHAESTAKAIRRWLMPLHPPM
ncbi:SDR family NAD(P)-dependent oxidoreductase [Kitasatospora sp. NPDC008050]|uniref:SDR family NAD(P)-dependent oxidoreductase n=1 Tax=Kitasatospora sp. NPDC008050 TaxID=3364021 RepID=UPI0036E0C556